jgi:hypothetical protein
MKHLKLYESKKIFWVYSYTSYDDSNSNYIKLFDDEESAKNYAINESNYIISLNLEYGEEERKMEDKDYLLTYEDVEDWSSRQNFFMQVYSVENNGKFELPEKIKILRNSRKYNL